MVDINQYQFKMGVAGFLGLTWVIAILIPLPLGGTGVMPPAGIWCLFGVLFGYFFYTGFRAWRRGWRSRFVLRVVVPIALLIVSSILEWAGVWDGLLMP
jgi:hypothetical protein